MTQANLPPAAVESRAEASPSRNGSRLSERVRSLRLSDNTQSGGQGGSLLPWILCGLLLVVCAAFGYRAYRVTPAADTTAGDDDKQSSSSSPAGATAASSGEVQLEAKGYVTPVHKIQVSPKVGGQVVFLARGFEEGAYFKEGDILCRIEDVDYKTDRDHTKAMLDSAEKDLQIEMANLEQLKGIYERNAALYGTSAVSQNDYDVARTNYQAQDKRVTKLKAAIDVTKADLEKMNWRLENTVIKAPISGIILTKLVEKFNLVNPSAFSNGLSASLCEMADLSDIEIDVMVQERDVAGIYKGQKCSVMPDAYQRDEAFLRRHPTGYDGIVSRLMPTADRSKGAISVRVKVLDIPSDEVGFYLKPDMGANVSFKKKPEN
jgi:RND family efflux transporter MFP subunit